MLEVIEHQIKLELGESYLGDCCYIRIESKEGTIRLRAFTATGWVVTYLRPEVFQALFQFVRANTALLAVAGHA